MQLLGYSCKKADTEAPFIVMNADTVMYHYLGTAYIDPGAQAIDNYTCDLDDAVLAENNIDIYRYGPYAVTYTATDDAGNTGVATRVVDIILQPSNYYSLDYSATDSCTSGVYNYTGSVQDCDCDADAVTVLNISNFGASATFTLPLTGRYNHIILLDTTKSAITFSGAGIMSRAIDTIQWNYTISDSITEDVCTSTWVKN
ncbi:MAG: DUF5011 domain-containing protein [Chitinophagales bacterium]|nr:DUF5011 domain-containing protein [Chitinophagales bacterium]